MKDDRLYARFTLDFPDHHKIAGLSDSAFRTLVEMTLHSRRLLSDGFIDGRVAKKKWKARALLELTKNDVEKPSLYLVDGGYMIHDYSEQQDTRAEVEARRARNAANGRRGGLARHRVSDPVSESASESLSEIQAETKGERKTLSSSKREAAKRGSRVPDDFALTDALREWGRTNAPLVNLDQKLPEWIDYWRSVPGAKGVQLDWVATWRNGMRKQQQWATQAKGAPKPSDDWMNR